MIYLALPPDDSEEKLHLVDREDTLEAAQALVGGGLIEFVQLGSGDGDLVVGEEHSFEESAGWKDERDRDGQPTGRRIPRPNLVATMLAEERGVYLAGGSILGPAYCCGHDDEGGTTDVTVALVRRLNRLIGVRGLGGELLDDWWPWATKGDAPV